MGGTIAYSGKGYKSGELKYTFFFYKNRYKDQHWITTTKHAKCKLKGWSVVPQGKCDVYIDLL